jgi:hypothetical protein
VKRRIEIARFRIEIWKTKGSRRRWNGKHVPCLQGKTMTFFVTGIYVRTDKDKKELLNAECLNINEEIVYVKVTD